MNYEIKIIKRLLRLRGRNEIDPETPDRAGPIKRVHHINRTAICSDDGNGSLLSGVEIMVSSAERKDRISCPASSSDFGSVPAVADLVKVSPSSRMGSVMPSSKSTSSTAGLFGAESWGASTTRSSSVPLYVRNVGEIGFRRGKGGVGADPWTPALLLGRSGRTVGATGLRLGKVPEFLFNAY